MEKQNPFNAKVFAILLEKAKGDRTTKQFAADCGISYVQLHKLEMGRQTGAPGLPLMKKLANNSVGGIELADFLLAAGTREKPAPVKKEKRRKSVNVQEMFENLSASQQKTVYDFLDYLLTYKH